jgi:hypothetical protein
MLLPRHQRRTGPAVPYPPDCHPIREPSTCSINPRGQPCLQHSAQHDPVSSPLPGGGSSLGPPCPDRGTAPARLLDRLGSPFTVLVVPKRPAFRLRQPSLSFLTRSSRAVVPPFTCSGFVPPRHSHHVRFSRRFSGVGITSVPIGSPRIPASAGTTAARCSRVARRHCA